MIRRDLEREGVDLSAADAVVAELEAEADGSPMSEAE
jgi:hypothetical protein